MCSWKMNRVFESLGLNPDLLTEQDIKSLEQVATKLKLPKDTSKIDPNQVLGSLRKMGVDIDGIIKRMKGNIQPKKSNRVKRNGKCTCGSGKKYKKCCG